MIVRPPSLMPIADAERAIATAGKVRDYLLNLDHPDGASKAVWFHSLGYSQGDWQVLAGDLLAIARDCDHFDTQRSTYGVKYKAVGTVGCAGHRPGMVLAVWVVEDEDPPRLVTAYPDNSS